MELILGVLVLVVFVWLAYRSSHSPSQKAETRSDREPGTRNEKSATSKFDVESAQHLPHTRELVGRAWIVDGDTIKINKTQIRLFGIDAPELEHPYGKMAKWALHRLCKGEIVRAEITDIDHFGRTVARCFLPDGRDISAEMVKLGLAIDWPKYSAGRYRGLEPSGIRKKLFLADARQKGRMHVWEKYEARKSGNSC